jgi:hypothetical protein
VAARTYGGGEANHHFGGSFGRIWEGLAARAIPAGDNGVVRDVGGKPWCCGGGSAAYPAGNGETDRGANDGAADS